MFRHLPEYPIDVLRRGRRSQLQVRHPKFPFRISRFFTVIIRFGTLVLTTPLTRLGFAPPWSSTRSLLEPVFYRCPSALRTWACRALDKPLRTHTRSLRVPFFASKCRVHVPAHIWPPMACLCTSPHLTASFLHADMRTWPKAPESG